MNRYKHKEVAKLLREKDLQKDGMGNLYQNNFDDEFQEFHDAVLKKLHGCKSIPYSFNGAYIYRDDCPYTLGYIGWQDYQDDGDGKNRYAVFSRKIHNAKYGDYTDRRYMAMSLNMDTAVKNASRYLVPYSIPELVTATKDLYKTRLETQSREQVKDAEKAREVIHVSEFTKNETFIAELQHLIDIEHKFVDPTFEDKLKDYIAKQQTADEFDSRHENSYYVHVHTNKFNRQTFDVAEITRTKKYSSQHFVVGEYASYDSDDVPEDVLGKVSVLAMMEKGGYVADVGYKVNDSMFYVLR